MCFFFDRIVFPGARLGNIIVEKVQRDINTGHISYIEVAHYDHRKRNDIELKFAIFYEIFDS